MRRGAVVLGLAGAFACAEGFAPGARVSFAIVPVFSEAAVGVLSGDLDQLHIRITRIPSNAVIVDTSVAVDTAGNVDLPLAVPLLTSPEQFEILLEGVRFADAAVLYTGIDTVRVSAGSTTPPLIEIPVIYVGPCQATSGCRVTVGPQGAPVTQGDSVLMIALVDSAGIPVAGVPVSLINLDTSLVRVRSSRFVVARTGTPGGAARVVAQIRGDEDTLRIIVQPPAVPALVIVTPGYAALRTVAPNSTIQLADTVKDGSGNLLPPTLATWTSRSPSVAAVSPFTGLVTGVARGSAVIVAQAGTAADSMVVTVGDPATSPGDMLVAGLTNGRAFGVRRVGQPVTIDVRVDQMATSDSLGSYNATFTWDPAVLRFDSTTAGNYPLPTVNPTSGSVRFAAVDANSRSGQLVLARLWFTALAAGADGHALQITELSGVSPAFNNYFATNRYVLVSGAARITP